MKRCEWADGNQALLTYHDTEWGVPVHDEIKHFEFLLLESFQAGLSWLTILKKRENFRKAFAGFDPAVIEKFTRKDVTRLLHNDLIIRNRRKIESAINNAGAFLRIRNEYGSFDTYIWHFTGGKTIKHDFQSLSEIPVSTPLSDTISRDLKKRGFSFLGPTTVYAHLQAIGIVNDHLNYCFRYGEI
ncbi:MAG: DNA-3-methyladenine glycosylase I [Spirochaetales bacterium]|nr:DNA-3-methyladenine glycosylase I [Spirochaetales bacterium]